MFHHKLNLADYWKSQERKYCDFCKCWIADNKPSVEFHEKGRRHKANVEKRIKTIQKQSRRDEKEAVRVDVALKKMESAALQAYQLDVANNADLTSIAINKKFDKVWHEAKSEKGDTYYWNTMTNESVWEPPSEGFLSIEEQRNVALDSTKSQIKAVLKKERLNENLRMQEQKQKQEEDRARLAREKLKERRVEEIPVVVAAPVIPAGKPTPYGQWHTVKTDIPVRDLQLPKQEVWEPPTVPEYVPEPIKREFKEKVVESLGCSNVTFKKRKFGMGSKRNTRQRLDDE